MSARTLRWLWSLAIPAGLTADGRANGAARLTIIRHHRVFREDERPLHRLGVRASVLAAQVELLKGSGLGPVTVAEGLARLEEGRPGHWVALSFDDGYADNVALALPLLAAARARATFYLTAGLMEQRRAPWWDVLAHALETTRATRLSWEVDEALFQMSLEGPHARAAALHRLLPAFRVPPPEQSRRLVSLRAALGVVETAPCELATWNVAEALASADMEVGAHTLSHPFLSLLGADEQFAEIAGSIELIGRRLGVRPSGLAYPGGDYDARTVAAARSAGLAYAVTTRAGENGPAMPRFELLRRGLYEGACLAPGGRFSQRLALAELGGAFDGMRAARRAPGS